MAKGSGICRAYRCIALLLVAVSSVHSLTSKIHGGFILQNTGFNATQAECITERVTIGKEADFLKLFNISPERQVDCSGAWENNNYQDAIILAFPDYKINCKPKKPCPTLIATRNTLLPANKLCYNLVIGDFVWLGTQAQIVELQPLTVNCGKYFYGLLLPSFLELMSYEQWNRRSIMMTLERIVDATESSMQKIKDVTSSALIHLSANIQEIDRTSMPKDLHSCNSNFISLENHVTRMTERLDESIKSFRTSQESAILQHRRETTQKRHVPNADEPSSLETDLVFWMLITITGITGLTFIVLVACTCWLSWEIISIRNED